MGKQRRRSRVTRPEAPQPEGLPPVAGHLDVHRWLTRVWFAPALFALIALLYFWEFPLSDKVIHGQDVGADYHKGKAPILEKLKDLEPSAWDPRMGGYPISEAIRHK